MAVVYKLHLLTDTELTFVLASGGHNVGVVNPPAPRRGGYRIHVQASRDADLGPDHDLACAEQRSGSWWPCWSDWLANHSGPVVAPPGRDAHAVDAVALGDAPGRYVLER